MASNFLYVLNKRELYQKGLLPSPSPSPVATSLQHVLVEEAKIMVNAFR